MPLDHCTKVEEQRVSGPHSSLCHWSELPRCFRGDSCPLSDGSYSICESCSFCTGQSPGGQRNICVSLHVKSKKKCGVCLCNSRISVFTSLLSTEPSQLRPITGGRPSLLLLLLLMVGMSLSKNGLSSTTVIENMSIALKDPQYKQRLKTAPRH